ncbi:hypothetical protein BS47DRAFT_1381315 [Hydnum rufescens UP504]|uniref:Carboxypeptidase n=1 Tax=Hydnum rufescens UP504 TaxID=1448309 RepID=A0A9P6DYR2_9AGAM|nr:hypothetical protein BS47DRAFT_1381315 [Hydnum rufescens UP504]
MRTTLFVLAAVTVTAAVAHTIPTAQNRFLDSNDVVDGRKSAFINEALLDSQGPNGESWTMLDEDFQIREFTRQNDIVYELVRIPEFPSYQIRVTSPQICDPTVQQYSGYFDVGDGKHLFFWFFESRDVEPSEAPVVLWMNGGPGCSSITGLMFELGPCSIANGGKSTKLNPQSWTTHANMIFLDQPVNVGFSYSEGATVDTTPVAAHDVWVFLELFMNRYKQYSKLPFHIAAESYGGRYAPLLGAEIHKQNKVISFAPRPFVLHINLVSVIIGNGLSDPFTQYASIPEYACDGLSLYSMILMAHSARRYAASVPASLYCDSQLYGSFQQLGLNPYDVRRKCDRSKDGDLCYEQMGWIETYLNNNTIKAELGVDSEQTFQSCNMQVNGAFTTQGDKMHNSAEALPELLAAGIRVLIYAGNADFMCNFIGNRNWMLDLESVFQKEFTRAHLKPWKTMDGKVSGHIQSAGNKHSGAGNYTYVSINNAGHMVPYDKPEVSLDLFVRWIMDDTPRSRGQPPCLNGLCVISIWRLYRSSRWIFAIVHSQIKCFWRLLDSNRQQLFDLWSSKAWLIPHF